MDYQNIMSKAKNKLKGQFDYIIDDIAGKISSGSTGGEISSTVGKYIKDLEINNPAAYSLLRNDIQLYLRECEKQGLNIK